MYSGTTLTHFSGRLLGAHQKLDRIARKHLDLLLPGSPFPATKELLHFEGHNGPDAIKRKSPAKDEPWHYFQPFDNSDDKLLILIRGHYDRLVQALKSDDQVRAAFEASWLAHAVVDGLTPAHHFPYEEKLVELRSGQSLASRTTIKEKIIIPGETRVEQVGKNWKYWGPKGLFMTHSAFEWGVATILLPLSLKSGLPDEAYIAEFRELGPIEWFVRTAKEIASMGIYDTFYTRGWTPKLARKVRRELLPMTVRTVTLFWYAALLDAKKAHA
jgi:hypothetical protein